VVAMKKMLLVLLSASLSAQTTVPITISVNWPPVSLVASKYGPLPKWAVFGEAVGCNRGDTSITFGEGDVIATLRLAGGLQAFSRQDAFSLVSNSQATSKKNIFIGWLTAAANSVVDAKAGGLIGGGNGTGVGIVLGAEFTKIILPNLVGVLSLKQVIQYNIDGLQTLMSIPAGRCTPPWSVLFAAPAAPPAQATCGQVAQVCAKQPYVFDIDVPKDR
jgi:hypothetical protein